MSDSDPAVVSEPGPTGHPASHTRAPLAAKALSESYSRLRYQDTSLLVWQQQQLELQMAPPPTYLTRSQSAWYSSYGNQSVLIRDKRSLQGVEDQSRIRSIM
uniref:Uncharacterized protein n=1 Tax=Nothobranchius kadleci TaxID=1051664 RepID=A0A1A8D0Y9_NOTKA